MPMCNNNNPEVSTCSSNKWVINLSSKPITPAQSSLLSRGSNFAITPKPPIEAYIKAVEEICTKHTQGEAEELRVETSHLLKQKFPPAHQHHKGRIQGHKGIKKGSIKDSVKSRTRGWQWSLWTNNNTQYKATALLQDTNTYRTIPKDPSNKLKKKHIGILRDIKQTEGLKDTTYHKVYLHKCNPAKILCPSQNP